jgi:hypothetical protein
MAKPSHWDFTLYLFLLFANCQIAKKGCRLNR